MDKVAQQRPARHRGHPEGLVHHLVDLKELWVRIVPRCEDAVLVDAVVLARLAQPPAPAVAAPHVAAPGRTHALPARVARRGLHGALPPQAVPGHAPLLALRAAVPAPPVAAPRRPLLVRAALVPALHRRRVREQPPPLEPHARVRIQARVLAPHAVQVVPVVAAPRLPRPAQLLPAKDRAVVVGGVVVRAGEEERRPRGEEQQAGEQGAHLSSSLHTNGL